MKRGLMMVTMMAVIVVGSIVPTLAMVGVEKPEDPDMLVITAIEAPIERVQVAPVDEVKVPGEWVTLPAPVAEDEKLEQPDGEKILICPTGIEQTYSVTKGDTLWKISARLQNTTDPIQIVFGVEEMVFMNELSNPDVINLGDSLKVPYSF